MADYDGLDESVVLSPISRKRKKQCSMREKEKAFRHSSGGKIPSISCNHVTGFCKAREITPEDLLTVHTNFYKHSDKVSQDGAIISMLDVNAIKRARVQDDARKKSRNMTIKYFLCIEGTKRQVCQASFCSALSIKPDRVLRIAKHWFEHGTTRPEQRGGNRKLMAYADKRDAVKNHIQTFTCRASHYGRKGAPGRKYLPSDLNIKRMHELYLELHKDQEQLIVGYHFYYGIFMYNFNLGFGHPATDTCSTCHSFKLAMKNTTLTNALKQTKTAMYILHRRKARKFYSLLNDVQSNEITICFDMMENLVLPKLPIGEAYYSRQLYLYVLGIVVHRGNQTQCMNDINFFTWLECQNSKDSNMICSALQHLLTTDMFDACTNASAIRLFSDSCYGQNKNINMVSMLLALKKQYLKNQLITHTFPERGLSYLPADRVFGRVQLDIKKHEQILEPETYRDILSRHGKVFVYGQHWSALDYKAEVKKFVKTTKTFKISDAKRVQINSDHLEIAQCSYHSELTSHSLLKKGKKWDSFEPSTLAPKNCVKNAKKRDVLRLLNAVGADDKICTMYEMLLQDSREDTAQSSEDDS